METIVLIILSVIVVGFVASNLRSVDIGTTDSGLDPYLEDLD